MQCPEENTWLFLATSWNASLTACDCLLYAIFRNEITCTCYMCVQHVVVIFDVFGDELIIHT